MLHPLFQCPALDVKNKGSSLLGQLPALKERQGVEAVSALGCVADDAVHNLHGARGLGGLRDHCWHGLHGCRREDKPWHSICV